MNEKQNMVLATTVCILLLVLVFLCPWRIESTDELKWSPIYQQPISYVQSYNYEQGGSRVESQNAHIEYGLLALEGLAVVIAGGLLYIYFSNSTNLKSEGQARSSANS